MPQASPPAVTARGYSTARAVRNEPGELSEVAVDDNVRPAFHSFGVACDIDGRLEPRAVKIVNQHRRGYRGPEAGPPWIMIAIRIEIRTYTHPDHNPIRNPNQSAGFNLITIYQFCPAEKCEVIFLIALREQYKHGCLQFDKKPDMEEQQPLYMVSQAVL